MWQSIVVSVTTILLGTSSIAYGQSAQSRLCQEVGSGRVDPSVLSSMLHHQVTLQTEGIVIVRGNSSLSLDNAVAVLLVNGNPLETVMLNAGERPQHPVNPGDRVVVIVHVVPLFDDDGNRIAWSGELEYRLDQCRLE